MIFTADKPKFEILLTHLRFKSYSSANERRLRCNDVINSPTNRRRNARPAPSSTPQSAAAMLVRADDHWSLSLSHEMTSFLPWLLPFHIPFGLFL
jgi:hypothetical protein